MSAVEDASQRVVLYYTDPGTPGGTKEAASFKMGELTGRWARFTLTVQGAEVTLLCFVFSNAVVVVVSVGGEGGGAFQANRDVK